MKSFANGRYFRFPVLTALAWILVGCAGSVGGNYGGISAIDAPPPTAASVTGWLTTADGSKKLAALDVVSTELDATQVADVTVRTGQRFQPFAGYGASITDATAWLLRHRLGADARGQLLQELFGEGGDLGLDLTRITIGSSDFSLTHYTYADTPGQAEADIDPARVDLIPVLLEIRAINPGLTVVASPWSAPAWMKTSHSLIKGRLDPAHYDDFARYLVSYAKAMKATGIPVNLLTIQNEPNFEPEDYPGMRVDPAERISFVGDHLGPVLKRELPDTRLLDWDHNWSEPDNPSAVLADPKAAEFIDGVAWHCYAGEVLAQSLVHDRFPDKETWFTECSAGEWSGNWASAFRWSARNIVIGAPRNWARGAVMWNLALDENHGPHFGGCGNCRGLITIDTQSGAIVREPEYYAFAHGSRFLPQDAIRVGTTENVSGIEAVAFMGRRDETVELIVFNGSGDDKELSLSVDGKAFKATMPNGSMATFVFKRQAG